MSQRLLNTNDYNELVSLINASSGAIPQYSTTAAALLAITGVARTVGKTVQIVDSATNMVTEYWFNGGTLDTHFVVKSSGAGSSKTDQVITFNQPAGKIYGNANFALGATSTSGLPITYQFDDATILTLVSGDTYAISKAGTVVITALQLGNSSYNAATQVQRTLVVSKANQTISFANPGARDVNAGAFASGATASSGLPVTLASSNAAKATVSGLNITPVEDGAVTITATQPGNANYNAAVAIINTFNITISEILVNVTGTRTYEAETLAYTAIASAWGGNTSKDAMDNCIKRLKANNLYTDVIRFWTPFGGELQGKKMCVTDPSNSAKYLLFPNGIQDDGTDKRYYFTPWNSKYGNTNVLASSLDATNFCLMTFQSLRGTNTTDADNIHFGATDGTNELSIHSKPRNHTAKIGSVTMNMMATDLLVTSVFSDGIYSLSVKDGVATFDVCGFRKQQAISTQTLPAQSLFLGAMNSIGTAAIQTGQNQNSFYLITKNITPGKQTVLASIFKKYLTDQSLWTTPGAMFLGDSITQGYAATNLGPTKWTSLVCAAKGWSDEQNYGVTGICLQKIGGNNNTVPDKVTGAPSWNWPGLKPYNERFNKLFIAYGINDVYQYNTSSNPVADFNTALRATLNQVLAVGWTADKIVLLSTYFIDTTTVAAGSDARQTAFDGYLQGAATDYGIQYVDVKTAMANNGGTSLLNPSDYIHPLDPGHQVVANAVLAVI